MPTPRDYRPNISPTAPKSHKQPRSPGGMLKPKVPANQMSRIKAAPKSSHMPVVRTKGPDRVMRAPKN